MVTSDYVNSNKIYNEGDYLRISFEVPYRDNENHKACNRRNILKIS